MADHSIRPDEPSFAYQDEHLVVVDKASGELVHRGWGRDGPVLLDRLRQALHTKATLHPIHRLDRGTSGLVAVALDKETARRLAEIWGTADVEKRYVALVRGTPPDEGTIDHPIPRRPGGPRVEAVSTYRLLATETTEPRHTSLVEVAPRTGRLHQVRRHLKHLGHPVIGDANYGRGRLNRALAERYGVRRLSLHAYALRFRHPWSNETVELEAPLPEDLAGPLEAMGFDLSSLPNQGPR